MRLFINKGDQDLGPFGLNEARALVKSGEVTLDNLAWIEDSPSWIKLREVPGLLPFPPEIGPAKIKIPGAVAPAASTPAPTMVSAAGVTPPTPEEEEQLWRGHPSQWLNFQVYAGWLIILAATATGGLLFFPAFYALPVFLIIALVHGTISFLRLKMIDYTVTTQRVRVISGLFSKSIEEIELFRVKDTSAHQPFFLRLLGLGSITILSGDERTPKLVLNGIPKPIELRERLRHEVIRLRQRFGIRELDVM